MLRIFKFDIYVSDFEDRKNAYHQTGYVCGKTYGKAARRLEKYCTNPDGSECDLIELKLMEVDSCEGGGILLDEDIEIED